MPTKTLIPVYYARRNEGDYVIYFCILYISISIEKDVK